MGYQEVASLTKRVPLAGDYWATIRVLSSEDEDAIQAIFLGSAKQKGQLVTRPGGSDGARDIQQTVDQEMDSPALVRETLLRGITEWNLDDEAGVVWPIDAAHLKRLTARHRNLLFTEIQKLDEPAKEDDAQD